MSEQLVGRDVDGTPALITAPRPDALDGRETAEFLAWVRTGLRRPSATIAADAHRLSRMDGAPDLILGADDDLDGAAPAIRRWITRQDIDRATPTRARAPQAVAAHAVDLAARERDERQTTRIRRIIERNLAAVRLEQMRSWQNQAMGRLQDLVAGRNGLRGDARPLAASAQQQTRATIRRLLHEMSENAFAISVLEGGNRRWWAAVEAGREAVRLRRETALEATGASLPALAKPHLQLARALFMLKGNSPELRRGLAQAREELPASAQVAYRSAQYHVMAGEHAAAYAAIRDFRADPRIARDLLPLIDTAATRAPWQAYPCNYYNYRYGFAGDDRLNALKEELVAIATWVPGAGGPVQAIIDRAVAEATSAAAGTLQQNAPADDPALEDFEPADRRLNPGGPETYDDVAEKRARATLMRARAAARAGAQRAESARDQGIRQAAAAAALQALQQRATLGLKAIDGFLTWNRANRAMAQANFASAAKYYEDCRLAILTFFQARYPGKYTVPIDQDGIYSELVKLTRDIGGRVGSTVAEHFRLRNQTLTLDDLYDRDWIRPIVAPSGQNIFKDGTEFFSVLSDDPAKGEEKLDAPLLTIAVVLTGFGLVEAYRMRRDFDSALSEARQIQRRHAGVHMLSQVIEVPFLKILTAEILLEKGDAEYRARTPAVSDPETRWNWITTGPAPLSGQRAHQSAIADGAHQHFFEGATATLSLAAGDVLFSNVYLDPANPPTEVMLQWNDGTGWEHRAFWGNDEIPLGVAGQVSRRRVGDLPVAGQWVRLQVPAADVGFGAAQLSGMAFTLFGGRVAWDRTGKTAADGLNEVVWIDDDLPAGARVRGEFLRYQGLQAAPTYLGVLQQFEDQGQYISKVNTGIDAMEAQADALLRRSFHPLLAREPNGPAPPLLTPAERQQFQALGLAMPIDTVAFDAARLAASARASGAYVTLTDITVAAGEPPPKETNPLIFAVLAEVKARLAQLEADLNYLGYRDDYVPPWRFQFLLERARHFTDAARNAERDYLNFLRNAEDEELKEMSAAQTVMLEKGNVQVETARVALGLQQVEAAQQASELAGLAARDADARVTSYRGFASEADRLADEITSGAGERVAAGVAQGALSGAASGAALGSALGPYGAAVGAVVGAIVGAVVAGSAETERANQLSTAAQQRQEELRNLQRARDEAARAADVAAQQLAVARAGLLVDALQRAAAIMRHEFAVQNLVYIHNRAIGSELWYRLAHAIRGVRDRYLRYAVEAAFLTEQAYEFDADKQMNVIRFDYDNSEVGSILAGDFLNADLDTLEQDLIVTQRLRQQGVRYIVSMARDFPDALQTLRETGSAILHIPLRRLEQRFPGLFNLRIGAVSVLPVALMDPTRFSMQLMHLGASEARLGSYANPALSGAIVPSWLPAIDATWPTRLRVSAPETSVFSGLTRAEERDAFPFLITHKPQPVSGAGRA